MGDLHVLHHLLQLAQGFLRLGHAALFHQLLDAVHHPLQVVLAHLDRVLILGHLLLVLVRVLLCLPRELPQVVIGGLAQLLHQLGDLLIAGAVLHRLVQPVLRALQPFQRVGQVTLFEQQRQIPERARDLVLLLGAHAVGGKGVEAALDGAQPQVGHRRAEDVVWLVADGAEDLAHVAGIVARPEQRAALLDERGGKRVEEAAPRQGDDLRCGTAGLARLVGDLEGDAHRQVGPGVGREVLDQRLGELGAAAGDGHRQGQLDLCALLGLDRKAIAAVNLVQRQLDAGGAGDHAVVIGGDEGDLRVALVARLDLALLGNGRLGVGNDRKLPRPAAGAVDGKLA